MITDKHFFHIAIDIKVDLACSWDTHEILSEKAGEVLKNRRQFPPVDFWQHRLSQDGRMSSSGRRPWRAG